MEKEWLQQEESVIDIQNRVKNLMWTVSRDYDLDLDVDIRSYRKSKYIAFYDAVREGCFARYFDKNALEEHITKRVYGGAEPVVLLSLAQLCIDSAVWQKGVKERAGVESIRRHAFADALEKDALRFTHTDWEMLEGCYLRFMLYGTRTEGRVQTVIDRICMLKDASDTDEVIKCLDEIYLIAYEKGFAKYFKGLEREAKTSDKNMKEYTDKDFLEEEDEKSDRENLVSLFCDSQLAEENKSRYSYHTVSLDEESTVRMGEYVERNYGSSYLSRREQMRLENQLCKGIHEGCRLHFTDGVLHSMKEPNAKTEYVKGIKEENLKVLERNYLVTRQNIQVLANTLKRALLTRNEKEVCSSEFGRIRVNKLWNIGRTDNKRLFERDIVRDNTDFAVEVLIDASGSQQGRQALVAIQGYIISEALSIAGIVHRVSGFCTFGEYTVLNRYRDYEDPREANERIFEFYGSANNRDGLAVQAVSDELKKRPEENKILIVLSDGRPNDIIAKSGDKKIKEPYCTDYAVKDTASEIRRLRNRKITVLGVFAGDEEDLQAEKKIFGKDFAYIRNITDFANVVGRYLKKQLLDV